MRSVYQVSQISCAAFEGTGLLCNASVAAKQEIISQKGTVGWQMLLRLSVSEIHAECCVPDESLYPSSSTGSWSSVYTIIIHDSRPFRQ